MRTRHATESIDARLLRQGAPKTSHEHAIAEVLDPLLSMPRNQREPYLSLGVDLLLEADLPAHTFDRALDLLWDVVYTPLTPDRSVQRAHQAILAQLLEVDPG